MNEARPRLPEARPRPGIDLPLGNKRRPPHRAARQPLRRGQKTHGAPPPRWPGLSDCDRARAQRAFEQALRLEPTSETARGYLFYLRKLEAAASPAEAFTPLPSGSATAVRLLADHDGDGVVGTAGELNENITYEFVGPDSEGLYQLRRGVDLNGHPPNPDEPEN